MSLPSNITRDWRKAEKFNFRNPSLANAEWLRLREKEARQLQGVGDEFTIKRKKEVFVMIVDTVMKKIRKEMNGSQVEESISDIIQYGTNMV